MLVFETVNTTREPGFGQTSETKLSTDESMTSSRDVKKEDLCDDFRPRRLSELRQQQSQECLSGNLMRSGRNRDHD
ncbi:hypothetical protein WAI453_004209 [Rhynchosporium graminicola]